MNELAATRATLSALTDARGVPQLQDILTRAEQDWAGAHAAVEAAGRVTHSLSAFHASLFHLSGVLVAVRDALDDYAEDVDALYWAHATTTAAVQPVLELLRARSRALTHLLFALPCHPPRPIPRRRTPPAFP